MGTKVTKVIATAIDRVDSPFAMQRIDDLKVTPGASRVIIQFNTLFATVPVVEVSRVDRQLPQVPNPIFAQFPIFGGLRQVHTIEFRELDSFTQYRFNIKAAGGPDGGVGLTQVFGDFFTGTRSGQILFDRLQIYQRGDRDMYFNIEIYDGTGANHILSRFLTGHRFLDVGQYDQPFPGVNLKFAPDSLRFSITGYNTDKSFPSGFGGFAHGPGPETLSSGVADGNRYADNEDAILTGIIQTVELGHFATKTTQTIPFALNSINKRFGYSIEGRVIYQVKDHPKTIERARIAEIRKRAVKSAATTMVGQGLAVAAGGKEGRSQTFALGPDDTAYRQIHDTASGQSSWQQIGEGLSGPLTALGSETARVDLFAAGKNGTLLHAAFENPGDRKIKPVWYAVGDVVDPNVFVLRGVGGSAHVFGLDRSGAIRHLKISATGEKREPWDTLEGKFAGAICVVAQKDAFHVLVSDPGRGVFYRLWPAKRGDRAKTDWIQLAGFKGPASAILAEDGSLVAVGFEHGNPSAFKVRTASKGWGAAGWTKLKSQEPPRPTRFKSAA